MTPEVWLTTTFWLIVTLIALSLAVALLYARMLKQLRAEEGRARRRLAALERLIGEVRARGSWS